MKKGRVELHPGLDAWMMGDRFGEIEGHKLYPGQDKAIKHYLVRMDRSGRVLKIHPERLTEIGD